MNLIDWFCEAAPIIGAIGGLIGGIGAATAAILLVLTLRETRKQTGLGYRGFLGVSLDHHIEWIRESKSVDSPLKKIKMHYMFLETNRAPLLLRIKEFRFSEESDIDVKGWYETLKFHPDKGKKILSPVIINTKYNLFYEDLSKKIKEFYDKVRRNDKSAHTSFAVHSIFQYENLIGESSWVYVRWRLYYGVFEDVEEKPHIGGSIVQEEYRCLN